MRKCRQNPITQAGAAARDWCGKKKVCRQGERPRSGNPGGRRLEVLDIPEVEGVDMPKPHEFLSAEQRDGSSSRRRKSIKKPREVG